MKRMLKNALFLLFILTLITGLLYPFLVTGIAQLAMKDKANGSLLKTKAGVVGSSLIGQQFRDPKYFHGRPSAAGLGYDAQASGASNLGPTNRQLIETIEKRTVEVRKENGLPSDAVVPSDLVTASGSGLDQYISPESAYLQVNRVAKNRGITTEKVRNLVDENVEGRQFFMLGKPKVSVLLLNLKLDQMTASR